MTKSEEGDLCSFEGCPGRLEVGAPLPWDMVRSVFPAATLEAEHRRIMRLLAEEC